MDTCSNPAAAVSALVCPVTHFLLAGSFSSLFLYLLAFNPHTASLTLHRRISAEGPHQFLAVSERGPRDVVYATTWATGDHARTLSAWRVVQGGSEGVEWLGRVAITATSSYIQLSQDGKRIYSAGGPTGEVHAVDETTGGFGDKLQELLYVEPDELDAADKTRVALRFGSHGTDLTPDGKYAFVPHLGHNSIFMYSVNPDGTLNLLSDCPSFGDGEDGPRHVVPSRDGTKLYVVTEHTSFVDVYSINPTSLTHLHRHSIIPPDSTSRSSYRGDTLRLSHSGTFLYATTRGKTPSTKGQIAVWRVAADGTLGREEEEFEPITRWETPTSGGKANAVEPFPFHAQSERGQETDWIVLTDDEVGMGYVWILKWDERTGELSVLAELRIEEDQDGAKVGVGTSHAVWLS